MHISETSGPNAVGIYTSNFFRFTPLSSKTKRSRTCIRQFFLIRPNFFAFNYSISSSPFIFSSSRSVMHQVHSPDLPCSSRRMWNKFRGDWPDVQALCINPRGWEYDPWGLLISNFNSEGLFCLNERRHFKGFRPVETKPRGTFPTCSLENNLVESRVRQHAHPRSLGPVML